MPVYHAVAQFSAQVSDQIPLLSVSREPQSGAKNPRIRPHTDIVDNGREVLVLLNMPGVPIRDIMVEVDGHELTVSGCSSCGNKAKSLPAAASMVAMEFVDVEYRLTLELSPELDNTGIRAFFRDGVLVVNLPRRPKVQRRIPVENA